MNSKRLEILLVDDDPGFRAVCKEYLSSFSANIVEASNGKEASSIVGLNEFDLILSDVKMPVMHGIELLHFIKRNHPQVVFALMTGFSDILDAKEAHEMGASAFLCKPFKGQELEDLILRNFSKSHQIDLERKADKEDPIKDFCSLPIEDFVTGSKVLFPIYLKLSDRKMIKISNQGEDLPRDMLARLKSKGINYLYIKNEDFKAYTLMVNDLGLKIKNSPLPKEKKAKFFEEVTKQIYRLGMAKDLDQELFDLAQSNLNVTLSIYAECKDTSSLIDDMMNSGNDLFAHSLNVSILATAMAKNIGWTSPSKLFLVSTAGLFHDVGKKDFSEEMLAKPFSKLSDEERELYMKHSEIGAELVKALDTFPDGLDQIIMHHHEQVDGSGFPNGFGRVKIHPVAKMINIADAFCHELVIRKSSSAALDAILVNKACYELEFLNALDGVLSKR